MVPDFHVFNKKIFFTLVTVCNNHLDISVKNLGTMHRPVIHGKLWYNNFFSRLDCFQE